MAVATPANHSERHKVRQCSENASGKFWKCQVIE
jgi:hypothetical protein